MRILHVTDGLPPRVLGGTGAIVLQTACEQAERKNDVHILTAGPDPATRIERDVTVHTLPEHPQRWAYYRSVFSHKRAREVLQVIRTVQPDLIHLHTVAGQCGYVWIAPAARDGVPIVATAHDVMHVACGRVTTHERALWLKDLRRTRWYWNPLRTVFIRRALRQVRLLTVSDALKRYLEAHGLRVASTVHNGIPTSFWEPQNQAAARLHTGIPADVPVFLLAGRLGYDKGTTLVAQTLPPDAHLIVAGDSDRAHFAMLGDRQHVFPRQSPTEMRTLYAACDAVLVPSRCLDCFPTVCLEAMACGRPVLATSWGGAREAVADGITGWVMDPYDTAAWRSRMEWCAANRALCRASGEWGRIRAVERFSLPPYITRLEEQYQRAASAR